MTEKTIKIKTEKIDNSAEFDTDGLIHKEDENILQFIKKEPETEIENNDESLSMSVSKNIRKNSSILTHQVHLSVYKNF